MTMPTMQLLIEDGGFFKLRNYEGSVEFIMDKWASIRSSYDDNHLFFCTSDKKNIPFNREICCALSPFLFNLIQGTFEESCCRTNYDTYIILPDFSSKTVYDLAALMITGTIGELSAQCTKEVKSLHSFLDFKSVIVKEENDNDLTCSHEYRIEDDKIEDDGGDNGGEEASKDDRSDDTVIKMETGEIGNDEVNAKNDERVEDVAIPTSSKNKDDDPDMSDDEPYSPAVDEVSPLPHTFSCASPMQQILSYTSPLCRNEAADGENTINSEQELEEDEPRSATEHNGKTTPDFIGQDENSSPATNKAKENASVMNENLIEHSEDNHEENLAHIFSENRHVVKSTEITSNYKTLNCNVQLQKLKKFAIEDEDNEIRIRPGKKKRMDSDDYNFVQLKQKKSIKVTPQRPVNNESESDVSCDVDNTNQSKKRESGRSKAAVSYSAMECEEEDFGEPEKKSIKVTFGEPEKKSTKVTPQLLNVYSNKYGYNEKTGLYECRICENKYKERNSASQHMAKHQGRTTCKVCKKVLSRQSNLITHMKMVHNKEAEKTAVSYSAMECEEEDFGEPEMKRYSSKYGYNAKTGLYECRICENKYKEINSARHHMEVHQGRTKCKVCKKVLSRQSNLITHMKMVHNKEAEK